MLVVVPRAERVTLHVPIAYRVANRRTEIDAEWFQSRILNISESGVLFGPTALEQGASIEVIFASPIQIGSFGAGKLVCIGEVVRTTETGAAGARFERWRFLLES